MQLALQRAVVCCCIEGFVRQKGLEPSVFDCTVALVYEDGTALALPTRMLYSGQYHIFPVRQIASSGVLAIGGPCRFAGRNTGNRIFV